MMRLLFWCVIGWLLYQGVRSMGRSARPGAGAGARPGQGEDMVRCCACQLNVPKSEAVAAGAGRWACCAEHARQGPSAAGP